MIFPGSLKKILRKILCSDEIQEENKGRHRMLFQHVKDTVFSFSRGSEPRSNKLICASSGISVRTMASTVPKYPIEFHFISKKHNYKHCLISFLLLLPLLETYFPCQYAIVLTIKSHIFKIRLLRFLCYLVTL